MNDSMRREPYTNCVFTTILPTNLKDQSRPFYLRQLAYAGRSDEPYLLTYIPLTDEPPPPPGRMPNSIVGCLPVMALGRTHWLMRYL